MAPLVDTYHAVSLSGGKDSTAMLLLMLERDMFKYPEKFTAIGGKLVITQDKPRAAPARQEAER